jgi:hypothetical protein
VLRRVRQIAKATAEIEVMPDLSSHHAGTAGEVHLVAEIERAIQRVPAAQAVEVKL